jgi:hypothetical protein
MAEFKVFVGKYTEAMKARNGEAEKGDEREDEKWFEAYNTINPNVNGISIECFREGREMIMTIMRRKGFEGLMDKALGRFQKFSKATQAKIMEAMKADEENPAMFKEMRAEFEMVFNEADANKDGVLDLDEFKVFMVKNTECQKKRFGKASASLNTISNSALISLNIAGFSSSAFIASIIFACVALLNFWNLPKALSIRPSNPFLLMMVIIISLPSLKHSIEIPLTFGLIVL